MGASWGPKMVLQMLEGPSHAMRELQVFFWYMQMSYRCTLSNIGCISHTNVLQMLEGASRARRVLQGSVRQMRVSVVSIKVILNLWYHAGLRS